MELREFEAVLAVHQYGSFSGAAIALFVSQPALTRRVALIERELGVRLFVRSSRGVYLTDAGKAFIEPARRAVAEAAEIRRALGVLSADRRPALRITSAPSLGLSHLADVVAGFHGAYPETDITITRSESHASAVAAVESSQVDVAVIDTPVHSAGVVSNAAWEDDYVAVYTPVGPRRDDREPMPFVTADLLRGRPMIYLSEPTNAGQHARQLWSMVGVEPASTIETQHSELLLALTLSGQGISVLPRELARQACNSGARAAQPPQPITTSVAIAHRLDDSTPLTGRFVHFATSGHHLLASTG